MSIKELTTRTIIKRILIGLGVIILSAILTVIVVKIFYQPSADRAAVVVADAPSLTDLIKKYTANYKLDGYAINKSMSDSILSYKPSDTNYTVQVNSSNNIQFAKSGNSTADDITRATDNAKTFLTSNGFTKVTDQIYADPTQLLYDSPNTVCKIFSSFDAAKKTSSYGLVCADKKLFVAEHNDIQTLLKLYTQTGGASDFKNIVRTTYVEGNKVLSLLSINPQQSSRVPYTLIFASIDGKWSYIGSRITPSVDTKDSFSLSPQLQAAINDPKYGGLIAKYVK